MSGCCKKPKNPCMVCMRTVTCKTGLQCQGSCKAWIHYACCSYTPGKIKDIKAKLIKVRCPCPDCSPAVPKEEIVKRDSFSCMNQRCPVKLPPKCGHQECPVSKINQMPSRGLNEWPGVPCGTACKKNTDQTKSNTSNPRLGSRQGSNMNARHGSNMGDRWCPPPPPSSCLPLPCPPPPPCQPKPTRQQAAPRPVMPTLSVVENMCETVGLLSDQLNQLMSKMTSVLSPSGQQGGGAPCYCPQNPNKRN